MNVLFWALCIIVMLFAFIYIYVIIKDENKRKGWIWIPIFMYAIIILAIWKQDIIYFSLLGILGIIPLIKNTKQK